MSGIFDPAIFDPAIFDTGAVEKRGGPASRAHTYDRRREQLLTLWDDEAAILLLLNP